MRLLNSLTGSFILFSLIILLSACAGGPSHNPTVFPYEIDETRIVSERIRTVIIPHINISASSRNYLENVAPRIDGMVTTYLKSKGYKVLPQREFSSHWNTAIRIYGNPFDPTTGKVNMKSFVQIMHSVRDELIKTRDLDAFVFTDLIEMEVPFNVGLNHLARWDGVTRKPTLQGPGDGVSADFDWNTPAAMASLQVSIFDTELVRIFASRGGLDATDAIDTRSASGRYTRRRNILENEAHLHEGIRLAFHPFIIDELWPGNPDD
ncbi:MAG: hypothetical protein ACK5ME_05410 [Parahaliea sp.]